LASYISEGVRTASLHRAVTNAIAKVNFGAETLDIAGFASELLGLSKHVVDAHALRELSVRDEF
jgi:hypothetical protein